MIFLSAKHCVGVFLLILGFCIFFQNSNAAEFFAEFETPEQEQQYKDLIEELRCLVCQNQSLADSNAGLAQDLRSEVYQQVLQNKDNTEISDYLVQRYGDFVLYRPGFKGKTYLLWLTPFVLLLIALTILFMSVKKHGTNTGSKLSNEEQDRLNALLKENRKEQ